MAQDFDDLEIPAFLKISQEDRAAAWARLDAERRAGVAPAPVPFIPVDPVRAAAEAENEAQRLIKARNRVAKMKARFTAKEMLAKGATWDVARNRWIVPQESEMIEIAPKTYSGRQEAERAAVQYLAAQGKLAKGKAFDINPATGGRFAITWKEIDVKKTTKQAKGAPGIVRQLAAAMGAKPVERKGKVKRTHAVKDATKLIEPGTLAKDFDAQIGATATSYTVTKIEGRGKRTVKTAATLPEAEALAADMGERTMITPVDAKGNGGTPIAPKAKAKPAPVKAGKGKQADVDAENGILTIPDMTAPTYKGVYRATLAAFVDAGKAGDVKAIKAVPMKNYDSGWTMLAKFKARILTALASGKPLKWNGKVVLDPPKVAA